MCRRRVWWSPIRVLETWMSHNEGLNHVAAITLWCQGEHIGCTCGHPLAQYKGTCNPWPYQCTHHCCRLTLRTGGSAARCESTGTIYTLSDPAMHAMSMMHQQGGVSLHPHRRRRSTSQHCGPSCCPSNHTSVCRISCSIPAPSRGHTHLPLEAASQRR